MSALVSLWFLSHSLLTNNTYDTLRAVPATVFTLDVLLASPLRAPVCTKLRSKAPGRSHQCACQLRWETRSRHTRKPQLSCPLPTRHTIATIMRVNDPGFFGLPEAPCEVPETRMRRTRPAPACSASNLSRLMLTRVDALWLECQWCRQRSHQDAAARCCAAPCPCNPDACSSRDLEAEERGCLRLSEDTDSSQDGLLSILSVAARVVCVKCKVNTRYSRVGKIN